AGATAVGRIIADIGARRACGQGMEKGDLLSGDADDQAGVFHLDDRDPGAVAQGLAGHHLQRLTACPAGEPAAAYCPCTGHDHDQDQDQRDDDAQYVRFIHGSPPAAQPVDAVGRRDDVGDADAVLVVHDDDFALGDQVAVDEDVHGFTGETVEFDHRPLTKLQNVADGELGAPQFNGELNRDVHDHFDVAVRI